MVVYSCIFAQKCQGREIKPKNANEPIPFAILIIMMKFSRFLRFSLCDSIIEFRSKSEIEIQILVTMNIFAEAVIPISFWLCSAPQGYAPFRAYRGAVSMTLQGRPRLDTYGWEHNGQPQASMDDNRRKAFMYSTNFRISKKYNLFRNRPVIYNLYEIKL